MGQEEIVKRLLKAAEVINKQATKGGANYMVCSSAVANEINKVDEQWRISQLKKDRREKIYKIWRNL